MSGIAGIAAQGRKGQVEAMLEVLAHRGKGGDVVEVHGTTLGEVWSRDRNSLARMQDGVVTDRAGGERFAEARAMPGGKVVLLRDPVGVAPLYYGRTVDGTLCFASEVKALARVSSEVQELPPGHRYDGLCLERYVSIEERPPLQDPADVIASRLRTLLIQAVSGRVNGKVMGSWLSGGLDSSVLAALATHCTQNLHTFAGGFAGAPDLAFARQVAEHIGSIHHEVIVSLDQALAVLPEVIRALESFDALLVRSSITNYLVGKAASEHVAEVLSGEGGDELFAGYEYLKALPPGALPGELIDITLRLHNTALQRVDRCSSAHGLLAHVCFLDPQVLDYALQIPAEWKIRDRVEKWILREAAAGLLPDFILQRPKAKFWEGSGLGTAIASVADERIPDSEFVRARELPNGWQLNSKEELMYYRIFRQFFGPVEVLDWMGRTKGAPVADPVS